MKLACKALCVSDLGQTVAVPAGDDEEGEGTFDAVKYHEERETKKRGRKRKQTSTGFSPSKIFCSLLLPNSLQNYP